jgi:high affinity sulfate transporter 1
MRLAGYRPRWLVADGFAGLTVASMAIPQSMAVAQLAGLPAASGLYAVMPAMVLYGLFGSSRRLAVGPEPTLAILFAPTLASLAGGDPARYAALAATMGIICGTMLVLGGVLRLGFIADFLPRAVVLGYITGVALVMIVDQLGTLTGVKIQATDTLPAMAEWVRRIDEVNIPTLVIGFVALAIVIILRRIYAGIPAALVAVVAAAIAAASFALGHHGVTTIGAIPQGLPTPAIPTIAFGDVVDLLPGALAAAMLIFSDGIITARAVVAGPGNQDENRELRGFGAACLGAGLLQGFPVGVSASRTAVAMSAGARTQVFGWVAATAIAVVLLFVTGPLRFIPRSALAAVIIAAAISLFSVRKLPWMWRVRRVEALLAVGTAIAVLVIGLLPAVGLGVLVALGDMIRRTARPHHAILGEPRGVDGFHDIKRYADAQTIPGVIAFRFDAPLFSANAQYLREQVLALIDRAATPVRWFVLDAEAITGTDIDGLEALSQLAKDCRARGVTLAFARIKGPLHELFERAGYLDEIGREHVFPTVDFAVDELRARETSREPGRGS